MPHGGIAEQGVFDNSFTHTPFPSIHGRNFHITVGQYNVANMGTRNTGAQVGRRARVGACAGSNPVNFEQICTIVIDGNPWFVGKDVAAALGYKDTVNALKAHVDDDDKKGSRITTPSGEQTMTIINESGLYSLVLSSKLASANRFKRWPCVVFFHAILWPF